MLKSLLSFVFAFTIVAHSQDLSGISICIDPGHGPGNPNAGPTGLREADINFKVAQFLQEFLEAANTDTVILTHNNRGIQLTLSQREQIANNAGVTWFHSVHHNATGQPSNTTVRSTLMLLEEERTAANPCPNGSRRGTGEPEWPGESDVMSDLMGQHIFNGYRTSSWRSSLDWTFYGGCNGGFSLGVLNDLLMPGQLSEATFHDHPVEEAKMRNDDFLRIEARALAMSFFDYYDAGELPDGVLAGIVSDRETGEPLNGITVTMNPGDTTYVTDNFNNGLYIFHDLEPGTYTLTVDQPGYDSVALAAGVQANKFNFADIRLVLKESPVVTQVTPADSAQDVFVYDDIRMSFSRQMDAAAMQTAFVLDPPVEGLLRPDGDQRSFVFVPDFRFEFDTTYVVTILPTATDIFGHLLDGNNDGTGGDAFSWQFSTIPIDTEMPVVVDYFPRQGQTQVFLRDVIDVWFNQPLQVSTINQDNFEVKFGRRTFVVGRFFTRIQAGMQQVSLVPVEPMRQGSSYLATLSQDILSAAGVAMDENFTWRFNTMQSQDTWVTLSEFSTDDDFFSDPAAHPQSRGFIADSTSYKLVPELTVSDPTAARLQYFFAPGQNGTLFSDLAIQIRLDNSDIAALLVYGDASDNQLAWQIRGTDDLLYEFSQIIDWHGWRYVKLFGASDSLTRDGEQHPAAELAPLSWESITLQQTGELHGELYFEDLLWVHPQTTTVESPPAERPVAFELAQSYPNPFNPGLAGKFPETEIRYVLAAPSHVRLHILDQTGRRVRSLADRRQSAGQHRMQWDGLDDARRPVASGIYFVRMLAGDFQDVHKILLVR